MKFSAFCGVSVDGFLARPDHTLDFLGSGGQEPHGFEEFYESVDVVVMGRKTFEVVLGFGQCFYGKKPIVVLSSRRRDFSGMNDGRIEQMGGVSTMSDASRRHCRPRAICGAFRMSAHHA